MYSQPFFTTMLPFDPSNINVGQGNIDPAFKHHGPRFSHPREGEYLKFKYGHHHSNPNTITII